MSFARRVSVTATTDAIAETATVYLPSDTDLANGAPYLTGKLMTLIFANTDLTGTTDITVTVEATGEPVYSRADSAADVTVAPRQPTHGVDGIASVYAAGQPPQPVRDFIVLALDRIKVEIAQGGASKSGTFTAIIA